MRRLIIGLAVIVAIQVALVAVVYTRQDEATAATAGPWVSIDAAALQKVGITGAKGKRVDLQRAHGRWVVPARFDFPANEGQLRVIVQQLDAARPDLPVAISRDARARFHVARDTFERRLTFTTGNGKTTTVYLGKNAGAGRVYARLAGSAAVESIRFPMWRASTRTASWLDPGFLQFQLDSQRRIQLPHVTLVQTDGTWKPVGLADHEVPAGDKIQTLLDGLSGMQWTRVDGTTRQIHLPAQPTLTMAVTPTHGAVLHYRFYAVEPAPVPQRKHATRAEPAHPPASKPAWRVVRSGSDFVLSVAANTVKPLQTADLAGLGKSATHAQATTRLTGTHGRPTVKPVVAGAAG